MAVFSYDSRINSEVGEVSLSPVGITASNSVVFNYTTKNKEPYNEVDYNLINVVQNLFVDYGFIADFTEVVIDNKLISQDVSYSIIKPSGSSESNSVRSYTGDGLIKVDEYKDKSIFIWVGNGTLFEIGGDITRIVAPGITGPPIGSSTTKIYSTDISLEFAGESNDSRNYVFDKNLNVTNDSFVGRDYGSLGAHQNSTDFGIVSELTILDYENYGLVLYETVFGGINLYNDPNNNSKTLVYTGIGTISASGNARVSFFTSEKTDTSINLFTIFGGASISTNLLPKVNSYTSSGTLFSIGNNNEKVRYDYNQSSIVAISDNINYGQITSSGIFIDYESIVYGSNQAFNYGTIDNTTTKYPYGSLYASGTATINISNIFTGNGSVAVTGSATVQFTEPIPQSYNIESTNLFNVYGTSTSTLVRNFSGSGVFYEIGGDINSALYSYNSSSIIGLAYSSTDFGEITSSNFNGTIITGDFIVTGDYIVTDDYIDDYGYINIGSDEEFNYGYLIDSDVKYPYGLFSISGSYQTFSVSFGHTSSGTINIFGSSPTQFTEPSLQVYPEIDYGLYDISGSADLIRTFASSGTGSLFTLNESTPSVTYNYSPVITEYTLEIDYGTVTTVGDSIDNGLITNSVDLYADYSSITIGEKSTRFGSISTSGSSTSLKVFTPVASGSLFSSNGASVSTFVPIGSPVPTDTVLYKISGSSVNVTSFKHTSSGSLFTIGDKTEKVTYNYHINSFNTYETLDYQTIQSTVIFQDYGAIDPSASQVTPVNYGYITISETIRPYEGSIKVTGTSEVTFVPILIFTGTGSFNVSGRAISIGILSAKSQPESTDLYNVSGAATYSVTRPIFTETVKFSTFSGGAETTSKSYNKSSINLFDKIDYQLITSSGLTDDYGLVSGSSSKETDFGYIVNQETLYPFGTLTFTGVVSAEYKPNTIFTGSGSLFSARGSAQTVLFAQGQDNETRLFNVSGSAIVKVSRPYITEGSLFNIGSNIESAAYSYNPSSINVFSSNDYGYISSSVDTTVNYGLISQSSVGNVDLGYIVNERTLYPYGKFTFAGQSSVEFYRRPSYVGSGSLFAYRGSVEIRSFSQGQDNQTRLFNISGKLKESFSKGNYAGTGSLFNIGSKNERRTYVYDASSIVTFSASVYQYINSTASVYEDYGLVSQLSIGDTDLGYIVNQETLYPFGRLIFTGVVSAEYKPNTIFIGSGSLFATRGSAQSVLFTQGQDTETRLFNISGSANIKRISGYSGTGSLFNIGSKDESRTYSYNKSSFSEFYSTDYGYITSVANQTVNYGLVSESSIGDTDLGYIIQTDNLYPFGTLRFSGSASTARPSNYSSTGTLFSIGGASQTSTKSFAPETSLFTISGTSSNIRRFGYSGTGSLFDIGTNIESRTYVYNESSILDYNTLNYEDIGEGATIFNNYGTVTEGSSEYYDYGSILYTDIVYPYGGFNISGGTAETFAPILAWTGSGSINVSGSVRIVFNLSAKIEATSDDTIKISGSSKTLFSLRHIGSGTISNVGNKIEKATYSYNTSSIVPYGTADYQFISNVPVTTPDYGSVTESSVGVTDLGSIVNLDYAYPFGSIKVSDSAVQKANRTYIGSGSLFAIGGESNAYSRIARSETQLFVVSGILKESFTKGNYAGSGSLFTFRSLTESSAVNPPATGLFRISGIAQESATDSWVGTGSITLQTAIYPEYLYYRPTPRYVTSSGTSYISGSASTEYDAIYTNVGSGVIYNSGSASTPRTRPFIGAGVEFISGTLQESFTKGNYAGSGSLFTFNGLTESSTKVLPSDTRLYTTSGSATTTRSEAYLGTGSLFTTKGIAESFTETVSSETQLFQISGSATILSTNNFVGSGSLFTFRSATESTTKITSTETQLFKVSGNATTSYNSVYTSSVGGTEFISGAATQTRYIPSVVGSGSLFTFNGLTESSTKVLPSETRLYRIYGDAATIRSGSYIGSGTEFISSTTAFSKTTIYSGSGSLFTFKGATESQTDVSISTGLFRFNGTVRESFIRSTYFGTGTVSILRGAAESRAIKAPAETQLFSITGTSTQSTTKGNYAGSGSEFISGKLKESFSEGNYSGSGLLFTFKGATESSSFVPGTKLTDLKISGSAITTNTESYQGTGSTFVYNSAKVSRTYPTYNASGTEFISGTVSNKIISAFRGSGNITEFGGAAESTFRPILSETLLYRISGTATTSFKTVYTAAPSGQFTYKGNADLLRRQAFTGSGSLFALNSATIAQRITFAVQTNLFRISGGERNSYTRISIFESGSINTSGKSTDEKVSFTPSRIFGTII